MRVLLAIFKRRKLWVHPEFQGAMIQKMIGAFCFFLALFYISNLILFWRFNILGEQMGLSSDHILYDFLGEQINLMNMVFVITSIVGFIGATWFSLHFSNRIAGPFHRMGKYLRELSEARSVEELEEKGPINFRKGDFFQEVADALNSYNDNVKSISRNQQNEDFDKAA